MVSIDIRDERVVRARGKGGHDRLELTLAAGGAPLVLSLEPGVDGVAPRRRLGGKAVPAWLKVEDSLQERGWAAELVVPLARLAGWGPGVPSVSLAATVHDVDVAKIASPERTASWSGALTFAQVASGEDGFLRETGLTRADLTIDTRAELDRATRGPERFVAGGDLMAVVGQQYSYVKLPVERATDVLKVELVDLRGDGSRVVLAHLRQRGGGGARQLLTVWGVEGGRLHMLGAVEVGKERGASRLASTWKLEPAGKWKQARGAKKVLVVRPQPAVAWDEDSYAEATATDAVPVHVPWDDDRAGGVVWLDGDTLRDAPLAR
jgi:hypothetical protein